MGRRYQLGDKIGKKWRENIGENWTDKYKLHRIKKKEKKENLGISLYIEVIGIKGWLREGKQRKGDW
jgi:hypothetical protein